MPVVLRVIPVTGAAFADDHGPINVHPSLPTIGMKWACAIHMYGAPK